MMKKFVCLALLVMGLFLLSTSMAPGQGSQDTRHVAKTYDKEGKVTAENPAPQSITLSGASIGAGLGLGLALIGAGWGFGRIGAAALESMARQPEKAGQIQGAMITIAALLEGATFFALLVCLLLVTVRVF
jgi:F-type H+-transporting ATPase subunit c